MMQEAMDKLENMEQKTPEAVCLPMGLRQDLKEDC